MISLAKSLMDCLAASGEMYPNWCRAQNMSWPMSRCCSSSCFATGIGTTHQRDAVVYPEVIGPGAFGEYPAQFSPFRGTRISAPHTLGPVTDSGCADDVESLALWNSGGVNRGSQVGFRLLPGLGVGFCHVNVPCEEGFGHGGLVARRPPKPAPRIELVGNYLIRVNVLRNVKILLCRVLKAGRAVAAEPDRRMGLLEGLGSREHLVKPGRTRLRR